MRPAAENLRQPVQHFGLLNRLIIQANQKYITTGKEETVIFMMPLQTIILLIHLKATAMKNSKLLFFISLLASMMVAGGCNKDKDRDKDIEEIVNIEVPETPGTPDEPEAPDVPDEPEAPADPEEPEYPEPPQYPGVNVGEFYSSFIGKWQQIDCGTYWPDSISKLHVKPNGHIFEFFEDSTALPSVNSNYTITNCRTDAEFLYYTVNAFSASQDYIYRYTFTGPDTLRLDYEQGIMEESMGTIISNTYKRL
jgi:hypothetical protein